MRGKKITASSGFFKVTKNGKRTKEYATWYQMMARCYNPKVQQKSPSYIGCSVAEEWHDYQVFAEWYTSHEYYGMGYELDKDLLVVGNKVYSPETCTLVPTEINLLTLNNSNSLGSQPVGVQRDKNTGRFKARLKVKGVCKHIGYYDTPEEASMAYSNRKEEHVRLVAMEYKDKIEARVYRALLNWKSKGFDNVST